VKILGVVWFNTCGIVRVETDHEGIKYFIRAISGLQSEKDDIDLIAGWGTTFPNDAGDVLFRVKL
jgi:hypothetical protein